MATAAQDVLHTLRGVFHLDPVPHLMRQYVHSRDIRLRRTAENISAVVGHLKHVDPAAYERLLRLYADKLSQLLQLVIEGKAPWVLHSVEWGREFLRALIDGAGTGVPLTDDVMSKLGLGDLCILAEREPYQRRVSGVEAGIRTLDDQLRSHA